MKTLLMVMVVGGMVAVGALVFLGPAITDVLAPDHFGPYVESPRP